MDAAVHFHLLRRNVTRSPQPSAYKHTTGLTAFADPLLAAITHRKMAQLRLQSDLADDMAMSEGKVSRSIEDFEKALEPLASPGNLSEISEDLPAVKAMLFEKMTTRGDDRERGFDIPGRAREVSEDMRSYRSRSPIRSRLDHGSIRSRSRSSTGASGQQVQQQSQKRSTDWPTFETQACNVVQGVSAVVECCIKCFFAEGDTNGKGHPFINCPQAQAKHKQLAVALEATEVAVAAGYDRNQGSTISFCINRIHANHTEAFECTIRNEQAHKGKQLRVTHTKSFAGPALPYVRYPCASCEKSGRRKEAKSHCALDCPAPTPETRRWIETRVELQALYQKARANAPKMSRGTKHPFTYSGKPQKPHVQHVSQPRARKTPVQQDRMPMNDAPYIHPARLHLHRHTELSQDFMEHSEPHLTWESAVLSDMLQREMQEHGGSWLDVALAVQGYLRHELMKEILYGDPAGGVPIMIPLLSVLDSRVDDLRLHPQEW